LEWSLENLTKFVDTRFEGHGFKKGGVDDEKKEIITWLEPGITPTNAELQAEKLLEEEKTSEGGRNGARLFCDNYLGRLY